MSAEMLRRAATLMRGRAAWRPDVTLAVADWLDTFADESWPYRSCDTEGCDYKPCVASRQALVVARAYLGETS